MRTTLDSLRIILSLKNTVNINSILHGLRSLPIIGKYISEKIYSIRFIKIIAFIISIQKEILKAFLGKLGIVLFLALVSVPVSTFTNHTAATTFLYGFVYFTLIFAFFHNIFGSTVEGNYAVLMMGMDPKKYVLARLLYKTASILIGYTLFAIPAAVIVKVPCYIALLLPISAAGYTMGRLGLQMLYFSARQSGNGIPVSIEGNTAIITILVLIIIFGGAAVSPWVIYYDMLIVCEIAVAIGVIAAPVGLFLIRKFPYGLYRTALYAEHTKTEISKDKCKKANRGYKEFKISEIKTNDKVESRSKGFKYLNDLFLKRHGSVLYGRMMMTIAIGAVLITLASIFLHYEIKESELPSQSTLRFLFSRHPGIFLFMLFVINSGRNSRKFLWS